jgi:predicted component of type VI protein secretion system
MMKLSPNNFKNVGRGISTDYSPEAVSKRIRKLDQLWALGQKLRQGSKEEMRKQAGQTD